MNANEILRALPHFTGTEHYYRTMFKNILLTDGSHYVREACQAYWLIDAIGSYLIGHEQKDSFASIKLQVKDHAAVLTLDDGNGNVFARQEIEATDFPLESIQFYAAHDSERWIILLPSEY